MNRRSGLTLLELSLAMGLLAVVSIQIVGAMNSAAKKTDAEIERTHVESQARFVLRKIGFAIMGSHPDSLVPDTNSPLATTSIRYQVSLGVTDGEMVWSEPEKVALEEAVRQVYWSDNPDADEERRIVWTSLVAPYLEGEIPNGMDDNGNGLIDEKGLSFTIDRNAIRMSLTLERRLDSGELQQSTVTNTVTCRNTIGGWREAE